MRKRNGHKLRRLKQRMTKAQLDARAQKVLKGGTWRQAMVDQLNQTFNVVATVLNKNQQKNDNRHKVNVALHLVTAGSLVLLAGHALGWW